MLLPPVFTWLPLAVDHVVQFIPAGYAPAPRESCAPARESGLIRNLRGAPRSGPQRAPPRGAHAARLQPPQLLDCTYPPERGDCTPLRARGGRKGEGVEEGGRGVRERGRGEMGGYGSNAHLAWTGRVLRISATAE